MKTKKFINEQAINWPNSISDAVAQGWKRDKNQAANDGNCSVNDLLQRTLGTVTFYKCPQASQSSTPSPTPTPGQSRTCADLGTDWEETISVIYITGKALYPGDYDVIRVNDEIKHYCKKRNAATPPQNDAQPQEEPKIYLVRSGTQWYPVEGNVGYTLSEMIGFLRERRINGETQIAKKTNSGETTQGKLKEFTEFKNLVARPELTDADKIKDLIPSCVYNKYETRLKYGKKQNSNTPYASLLTENEIYLFLANYNYEIWKKNASGQYERIESGLIECSEIEDNIFRTIPQYKKQQPAQQQPTQPSTPQGGSGKDIEIVKAKDL